MQPSHPLAIIPRYLWRQVYSYLPTADINKLLNLHLGFARVIGNDGEWKAFFYQRKSTTSKAILVVTDQDEMEQFWLYAFRTQVQHKSINHLLKSKSKRQYKPGVIVYYKLFLGKDHDLPSLSLYDSNIVVELIGNKESHTLISSYMSIKHITITSSATWIMTNLTFVPDELKFIAGNNRAKLMFVNCKFKLKIELVIKGAYRSCFIGCTFQTCGLDYRAYDHVLRLDLVGNTFLLWNSLICVLRYYYRDEDDINLSLGDEPANPTFQLILNALTRLDLRWKFSNKYTYIVQVEHHDDLDRVILDDMERQNYELEGCVLENVMTNKGLKHRSGLEAPLTD